jgi:quinohemoprotein ethanol dehydrogenase
VIGALLALLCTSCQMRPEQKSTLTESAADSFSGAQDNWLRHGRTYSEQRFSPLDGINAVNVNQLGLAWWTDMGTDRGMEATPIVVDGVIYVSAAWNCACRGRSDWGCFVAL